MEDESRAEIDDDSEEEAETVIKVNPSDIEVSSDEEENKIDFDDMAGESEEVKMEGEEGESGSEEEVDENEKKLDDLDFSSSADDVEGNEIKRESKGVSKVSDKVPKKRGRKKDPRRLDGKDGVTSEEEDGEEVPVRFGTGYHILYKRKVLRYAKTHSNSATAEKFGIKAKLVREWRKQREKIEIECEKPHRKRSRNDGYTVEEKLQAIAFASERSTDEARLLYNVDKRTIEKWRAKKDRLEARLLCGQGNAIREVGSGCKPKFAHIEDSLRDWILGLRLKGVTVNPRMILAQAKKIIEGDAKNKDMKVPRSSTWVVSFLKRHNLYSLLGTTLGHEDPKEILTVSLVNSGGDVSSLANKIDEIPENLNKRNRRRITLEDKVAIISRIQGGETQGAVAKSLGVATSTIQTIWSCRNDILRKSTSPGKKSKCNTLFWRKYSVIASALQDWYDRVSDNTLVDAKLLTEKAIQLSEVYRLPEFKSESREWLKIFCKRRELKEIYPEFTNSQSAATDATNEAPSQETEPKPETANTPTSDATEIKVFQSCDGDNSSSFHETETFNFDMNAFMNSCNAQTQHVELHRQYVLQPTTILPHPVTTSSHHIIQQPLLNTNLQFSCPSPSTSHIGIVVPSVTILDAMKYLGLIKSWVVDNYGPSDNQLNTHLSAIENAILKKRTL